LLFFCPLNGLFTSNPCRKSSQKPDEDFYSNFKRSFPELCPEQSTSPEQKPVMLEDAVLAPSLSLR
jgi:hypothetical protein